VHHEHAKDGKIRIRFVGVWDTVDAVGLPVDELAWFINDFIYQFKFPDLKLRPIVDRACQALSIDDERQSFQPVMWDERSSENPERIEQVWFAGAHSNVGGGYRKQGVSLVSLDWMMSKAESCGLRFLAEDRQSYRDHRNIHDHLYNSRSGLAMYYRYKPRDISKICKKYGVKPKIHESVFERIAQATEAYAPGNLPMSQIAVVGGSPKQDEFVHQLLSKHQSLLRRVRGWVWLRRFNHYIFLLLTLALAVTYLWIDVKKAGSLPLSFSIPEVAKNLVSRPFLPALVLALLAACFCGLSLVPRRWMSKVFSRFWHGLLDNLQGLFGYITPA
jgi:type VI secretion system (T6SS) phospholipase Tle1-like effector